jgi:hypothetical protein
VIGELKIEVESKMQSKGSHWIDLEQIGKNQRKLSKPIWAAMWRLAVKTDLS